MSECPKSAKNIFMAALDQQESAARVAFVDQACGSDANLRQDVQALLKAHDQPDGVLDQSRIEARVFAEPGVDESPRQVDQPQVELLARQLIASNGMGQTQGVQAAVPDCPSLEFLASSDKPGSLGRLGSYEIEEVVGTGGMGIVLRAFDEKLHRVVAIKVMTSPLATNEHGRRRFVREGRAAAAIRDDHVIGIHGVDEVRGLPFLVMEYVVGRSLAQRIEAEGALPVADTLRIGSQIARGLAAAHAQGLVHRDIKPANILLENGVERVKITDFGLAHAVDDVRTTQPGIVIGTPEYMSPEQAHGEKVDHRSDLFSLGCVLYAMCAGRPPFRADSTVAILRRVCEDTPRPLSEINPEIPEWLADVIDKLIAKDASERYQTAAEVADLLSQFLAHVQQPSVIPLPTPLERPRPARRLTASAGRHRWPIAAAAVLLLCAGLSLAESTGVTHVTATVIRIVRGDGTLVVEVDDPNIQVLVDGEELVITGAGTKEFRLRPGQHELQTAKNGKPLDTKLITITRDGREVVKVAREPSATASPTTRLVWADSVDEHFLGSPSPDGKHISYPDLASGDVGLYELATGKTRRLTNQGWPEFGLFPIFSPDSQRIAYSWMNKDKVNELRLIGIDGSEPRVLYANQGKEVRTLSTNGWSADGKFILATFYKPEGTQIVLVSTEDGSVHVLKTFARGEPMATGKMCLSPDGRCVAYSACPQKTSSKRDIFLLATDGSGETNLVEHPADDFVLGWAPDGKRLVFASDRALSMGVWLIRVADGKAQGAPELVKTEMGQFQELGISQSGSFYYGLSSGGQNVYTATLDLEHGKVLTPPTVAIQRGEGSNWAPTWSLDGRFLACQSLRPVGGTYFYIRSSDSKEVRELVPSSTSRFNVHSLNWSPDGLSLLGGNGARVDVETGAVTRVVPSRGVVLHSQWAPDGKAVFYLGSGPDGGRRLVRRDVQSGVEQELYQTRDRTTWWTLSPDGKQLAFSVDGVLKLLPTTGGEPRELIKGERFITAIAWAPDGEQLLFGKATVAEQELWQEMPGELWRVSAAGGEPHKLADGLPAMQHLRIHPDGRQIAFTAHGPKPDKSEVWVLENFLPPL